MIAADAASGRRFLADWHALTGTAIADKALIALSGGPDSTALLLLFAAVKGALNPVAATVDHRLRPESSAEAGHAADLAQACGIEHRILDGALPERVGRTANVSARARALRYALLEAHADAVGARWIVTAHHADDQLETIVMRLNRGSGVRGLAGVRPMQGRVVRPLLGWRGDELRAVVAAAGMATINDPSNVDDRYDRVRLRKQLADTPWLDPVAAARSAAALAEADAAVEWGVDRAFERHCVPEGACMMLLEPHVLPAEVRRRLVERCLAQVDPTGAVPRGGAVTDAMARLGEERPATLGHVGIVPIARDGGRRWFFRRMPPRADLPPRAN